MPALAAVTKDNTFFTALRTEIEGDPSNRGYAPFRTSGSDGAIADLMNVIIVGNTVVDGIVTKDEFVNSIRIQDMPTTAAQIGFLQLVAALPQFDWGKSRLQNALTAIFPNTTPTWASLNAKASRDGTRAEKLWGIGTVVSADDVSVARVLANGSDGKPGW
jgi:hypothetical protein